MLGFKLIHTSKRSPWGFVSDDYYFVQETSGGQIKRLEENMQTEMIKIIIYVYHK